MLGTNQVDRDVARVLRSGACRRYNATDRRVGVSPIESLRQILLEFPSLLDARTS